MKRKMLTNEYKEYYCSRCKVPKRPTCLIIALGKGVFCEFKFCWRHYKVALEGMQYFLAHHPVNNRAMKGGE